MLLPAPWNQHINDTDYSHILGFQAGWFMWKVWPPMLILLGSFGNIATILVMRRIKDDNSSQYDILKALAVADMSVLYSGTLFDWVRDVFGVFVPSHHTVLCKFMISVFFYSHSVSAWLVVTVTVQRTMAVLWPHKMRVMCTVRRTRIVIAVVVIVVYFLCIPILIVFHRNKANICTVQAKYAHFFDYVWSWMKLCITSLLPYTCLFVCDVILSLTLFRSTSVSSSAVNASSKTGAAHSQDSRRKTAARTTGMILLLSFTFLLLTLPLNCFIAFINMYASTDEQYAGAFLVFSVFSFLWDANSGVNFFLYCLTGTRFRKEFFSMVGCGEQGHATPSTRETTVGGAKRAGKQTT